MSQYDPIAPFLGELEQKVRSEGLSGRVQTHCMDMADLVGTFENVDLLWAEGSAYNLGFANALQSWMDGYYDILGPRAKSLLEHEDETVRALAAENLEEIEIFHLAANSYGYVFYLLQYDQTA